MAARLRHYMVALTGFVVLASVAARQPAAQTPSPDSSSIQAVHTGYVGAEACKECHAAHFDAWSKTKHSTAISKLPQSDRESGKCIRCHVTGTPEAIALEGAKPTFPGVQCEACHGAGQRHIEAARTGDAVTDRPKHTEEETCTRCHNETSPHYKPFFYRALVGLVHQVK